MTNMTIEQAKDELLLEINKSVKVTDLIGYNDTEEITVMIKAMNVLNVMVNEIELLKEKVINLEREGSNGKLLTFELERINSKLETMDKRIDDKVYV